MRQEYEKKMKELLGTRMEEKMELTAYYTKQIDFLQAELNTSHKIREILTKNNTRLKGEIDTLAKIIRTSRNHFKELEVCDFDGL